MVFVQVNGKKGLWVCTNACCIWREEAGSESSRSINGVHWHPSSPGPARQSPERGSCSAQRGGASGHPTGARGPACHNDDGRGDKESDEQASNVLRIGLQHTHTHTHTHTHVTGKYTLLSECIQHAHIQTLVKRLLEPLWYVHAQ